MFECLDCKVELIWGGDHTFEDYGHDGDGIVSNLSCPNCNIFILYFKPIEEGE